MNVNQNKRDNLLNADKKLKDIIVNFLIKGVYYHDDSGSTHNGEREVHRSILKHAINYVTGLFDFGSSLEFSSKGINLFENFINEDNMTITSNYQSGQNETEFTLRSAITFNVIPENLYEFKGGDTNSLEEIQSMAAHYFSFATAIGEAKHLKDDFKKLLPNKNNPTRDELIIAFRELYNVNYNQLSTAHQFLSVAYNSWDYATEYQTLQVLESEITLIDPFRSVAIKYESINTDNDTSMFQKEIENPPLVYDYNFQSLTLDTAAIAKGDASGKGSFTEEFVNGITR